MTADVQFLSIDRQLLKAMESADAYAEACRQDWLRALASPPYDHRCDHPGARGKVGFQGESWTCPTCGRIWTVVKGSILPLAWKVNFVEGVPLYEITQAAINYAEAANAAHLKRESYESYVNAMLEADLKAERAMMGEEKE